MLISDYLYRMSTLSLVLSILPGLAIAVYIYCLDQYDREDHKHLIIAFVLGMLSTIPAIFLEQWGQTLGWEDPSNLIKIAAFSFLVIALVEEGCKMLLLIYPTTRSYFDEPMDGIVYAVMIAMGFATLENVLYAMEYGIGTTITRAFTTVPAHASFGVMMGYYLGLAKFSTSRKAFYWIMAIVVPTFFHGAYDFFLLQELYEGLAILAIVVLVIGIRMSRKLIRIHVAQLKADNVT